MLKFGLYRSLKHVNFIKHILESFLLFRLFWTFFFLQLHRQRWLILLNNIKLAIRVDYVRMKRELFHIFHRLIIVAQFLLWSGVEVGLIWMFEHIAHVSLFKSILFG